jgi:hypothetical protein
MFNAAKAGCSDVLELVIAAATGTAAGAAATAAGDSSDCSAVARYMRCTSRDVKGYTLMHAAAAAARCGCCCCERRHRPVLHATLLCAGLTSAAVSCCAELTVLCYSARERRV